MKKTIPPATERTMIKNPVSIDIVEASNAGNPFFSCSSFVAHSPVQAQNLDNPSNSLPCYSCRFFSNLMFKIGVQLYGMIEDSV